MVKLSVHENWNTYIVKFPNLDVYYSKEYVQLFADVEDGVPEAVYYENKRKSILSIY
jgi:hypothetical protein